ncbi:phosphoglycerate kinase [Gordoniibacillus kamchatkensis]|uniref:Phosphoglycerate kinase n=1 Tax=Gordoniibacillus kamchatkensis TaxID=1590651 RepID=A0ABR5AMQ7_9BACL|nr:histidine phosphatase family protein [Paenibacillus sp. VKM B-2647]KIL42311.1 phosphoglycerate kinase [Paenibacillus sp. VKM B-2647]
MTTFYLVRHGVKEKVAGDAPLSPAGVLQAQATASYFRRMPIRAIYTSPLRRARETAERIALECGLTLAVERRLRERANWGDLPGQSFDEFVAMWDRCTRERDYVPPVGDSARQAGKRLCSLMKQLSAAHPGSEAVLVTHGGLITDFLLNEIPEERLEAWHPHFAAAQSELVPECSITKLLYVGEQFQLDRFASTCHLTHESP